MSVFPNPSPQAPDVPRPVGIVAVLGRPNAGKSSFLNALMGAKVSIVSSKPQTTRRRIRAIHTDDRCQIIFIDTPGLFRGTDGLAERLRLSVQSSASEADAVLRLIDPTRESGEEDAAIDDFLSTLSTPVVRVYTKADLIPPEGTPSDAFVISSVTGFGIPEVVAELTKHLPVWPLLYPDDVYTDQDIPSRAEEVIREKCFLELSDEIPYDIYVEAHNIEEREDGVLSIHATIFVDRDSQKSILIGKQGQMIAHIGGLARKDLNEILGRRVFLGLRVKTDPNWKRKAKLIGRLIP